MNATDLEKGHQLFYSMRKMFSKVDTDTFQRTPVQREFHECVQAALAQKVYGTALVENMVEIIQKNNFKSLQRFLAYMMARRSGKSMAIAIMICVILLCLPNINIAVFAPGFRQVDGRTGLLGHTKRALRKHFNFTDFETRKENLEIIFSSGDTRTLSAYSTAVKDGLRGIGGDILILEEAAYITPDVYMDIILPMVAVFGTVLIALSTLSGQINNFFTRLIRNDVFKVISVEYICDRCKPLNLDDICIHRRHLFPSHIDDISMGFIKTIYGDDGMEAYRREMLGMVGESKSPSCFDEAMVRKLFHKPKEPIMREIEYIMFVVDPCAGSKISITDERPSDYVLLSIGMPGRIVLGLDALDADRVEDIESKIVGHIQKILDNPMCRSAAIILDVESGTGFSVSEVYRLVNANFNRVITMDDHHRKPGREMLPATKFELVSMTQSALAMGEVCIWSELVTSAPDTLELLTKFKNQMLAYERIETPIGNFGKISVTYSGKRGKKKDDIALTFQRGIRSINNFFDANGKYIKYWGKYTRQAVANQCVSEYARLTAKGKAVSKPRSTINTRI